MVGFRRTLAMKKKIISYGIAHISFDLVRNILRIWYNYKMLILFVIIIGLAFVIFFNFHCFKSFFLSLFIWSYFTKNDRLFVLSTFKAWASVDQSFLSFLMGLFDEGLCDLCWLLLLLREHLSLFSSFSVDCAGFCLSDHFWSFCYLEISLVSNFVQRCGNLKKRCWGIIPPFHEVFWLIFVLISSYFSYFYLCFLLISLPQFNSITQSFS